MGGGGGNQGTTKYEWNDDIAPVWRGVLGRAVDVSETKYQPYGGGDPNASIAQLTPLHNKAARNMEDFTDALISPHGAMNAGTNQLEATLNGAYMGMNPGAQRNMYSGMNNPFFQDSVQQAVDPLVSNYVNSTSPELTRLMNLSGAFGGSAHTQAIANNQANLARQIGNVTSSMSNDQYNRSAGLEDTYLNRAGGAFDNERNRMMGAVGGAQAEQNNVMQRLTGLMGMGDMQRSYDQDVLNLAKENWMGQQNENAKGLEFLSSILSRAQGGMSNISTTAPSYGVSPYSGLMAAAMGYAAMNR